MNLSFIETQFPVSKLSKESYKERKANHGQTLTGLGKWWGRKPLILVRAALVGLLLPASGDAAADRDVFLRILTMDEEGLLRRRSKDLTLAELRELLTPHEQRDAFDPDKEKLTYRKTVTKEERASLQSRAFGRLSYDRKLEMCRRPEEIDGPSEASWQVINAHLGTAAASLPELIRELGEKRFGHTPRVGDAFCGGGSIPFEAARIGCEAFGSDLSPVAALLTWAALHIVGGGEETAKEVRQALQTVYDQAKAQIETWGIERNAVGWTADAYLYCHEVQANGWLVPLAPSWIIGERTRTIAVLVPDIAAHTFRIEIRQGVSDAELAAARLEGTWENGVKCPADAQGNAIPPHDRRPLSADSLRGREGLRRWTNEDIVPRPDDVFQERLYCIRWRLPNLETLLWQEQDAGQADPELTKRIAALAAFLTPEQQTELAELRALDGRLSSSPLPDKAEEKERSLRIAALSAAVPETIYRAPDAADLCREEEVLDLLQARFTEWQAKGYIPSALIETGDKTDEPIRTRGYTHWHHLFNPRQLLTLGTFAYLSDAMQFTGAAAVGCLVATGKMADFNSRLVRFVSSPGVEKPVNTFSNQALNTLLNYAMPANRMLGRCLDLFAKCATFPSKSKTIASDARGELAECDIWITDPAYADAINYEELSEFFLAWYDKRLYKLFPEWYTDSKRALAVRGSGEAFRLAMVDCYRNFASRMPDDGMQIVMFTHYSDPICQDNFSSCLRWSACRVEQACQPGGNVT